MVAKGNGQQSPAGGGGTSRRQAKSAGGIAVGGRVTEALRETSRAAKEVGGVFVERVGEEATKVTRQLREQGERFLGEQKETAAAEVGRVGAAIHDMAERLDPSQGGIARYVDSAAGRVDRASQYLAERDLGAISEDLAQAARARPGLFLGGMLLTGLLLGRFVRAGLPETSGGAASGSEGGGESHVRARRPQRGNRRD